MEKETIEAFLKVIFEQAELIEHYRAEIEFISKVDMVTNAFDVEHTQASVRDWATRALDV